MTTPDTDPDILLLLESSGELTPEQAETLKTLRAESPAMSQRKQDFTLLQEAGRFASRNTVPPTPDLTLERLHQQAAPAPTVWRLPLAVAAAVVIGLALRFHFASQAQQPPGELVNHDPVPSVESFSPDTPSIPVTLDLLEDDPVFTKLDSLDKELAELTSTPLEEDFLFRDSDAWASEWLAQEESI